MCQPCSETANWYACSNRQLKVNLTVDITLDCTIISRNFCLEMRESMSRKNWLILFLAGVSIIPALFDLLQSSQDAMSVPTSFHVAAAFKIFLIVLWIDADSKVQPRITRCFDYGFLVLIFWVPYFPFYLWRTRGVAAGILMYAGFLVLLSTPDIVQLLKVLWP